MTEAERKLFFLPEENLQRAIARCLAALPPDSLSEALAEIAPGLTGEKREPFLLALHCLARASARIPHDVPEIFALTNEIRQIIEEKTIAAENEDVADFIEAMEEFVVPDYLATGQLLRNWETHPSNRALRLQG
jgi:hypothetical protein